MTDRIYTECMMCHMIDMGRIKIERKTYDKAGGNPKYLSHGVCDSSDCINAYILFSSGGDEELAKILKEELGNLENKVEE